ncbi:hypothetical protein BAE44_0007050 [Dichanthelium oligosanthes]|uniref:F-box domain-containing protein n=1 Tax=Dichanthelium oligosanthes TaxID=888268 RepID=A0A1E5W3H9_9POAL|nr:hypothetical protein BAE44_0007050 [Dichanthelium oligosanthes]
MDEIGTTRRPPTPPPPLPVPPDELLLEILLRLPPEPIHLLRASLVCTHWRRLVNDPAFLRRVRGHHRAPPVLGFLNNLPGAPFFVRTPAAGAGFSPPAPPGRWWAYDCRHGRALLHSRGPGVDLLVWDLVTGGTRRLPTPPARLHGYTSYGTVLCAGGAGYHHGDCHSSPFLVVFMSTDDARVTSACSYASETGAWGHVASISSLRGSYVARDNRQTALVGNSLYWLVNVTHILEFNLNTQRLQVVQVPYHEFSSYRGKAMIMPSEDGGLGFAGIDDYSLHLWSRKSDVDGAARWMLSRIIDLNKYIPPEVVMSSQVKYASMLEPIGFAEGADVIFIREDINVFMMCLKSMQFTRVLETGYFYSIYPYTSFYTAGTAMSVVIPE